MTQATTPTPAIPKATPSVEGDLPGTKVSPASEAPRRVTLASRVPMGLPQQRLSVPEIPGYFCYWHVTDNVPRALRAGYEFVSPEEVDVASFDVAGDPTLPGGTDMGSRISQSSGVGAFAADGGAERLYLMKLPQEFRDADNKAREAGSEQLARKLRAGMAGAENDPDRARRYMKQGQDLFIPKRNRGS